RVALADTGDAHARREPRVAARVEHLARAGVAEGGVLLEPAAHLRHGRAHALGAGGRHRLANEVRPGARLPEQRLRAQARHRALSARRDDGVTDGNEDATLPRRRLRHLADGDLAGAHVLEDLLHAVTPYSRCHCSSTISPQTWRETSRRPERRAPTRRSTASGRKRPRASTC